jgi:hypothetical protein
MTPKQHFRRLQFKLEIAEFGMGLPSDRERIGECECCGEQKPLNFITTPLGHKTWECKECTAEWGGDSDGFNEQQGGY